MEITLFPHPLLAKGVKEGYFLFLFNLRRRPTLQTKIHPSTQLILSFLLCFLLAGCSGDDTDAPQVPVAVKEKLLPENPSCSDCHPHELDKNHAFGCTTCHRGTSPAPSGDLAHANLIAKPANPDVMMQTCGRCHERQVTDSHGSLHFTSSNEVNTVRRAFGAETDLERAEDIPVHTDITTPLDLADDLLRRRCLQCHIRYDGEYTETLRGTGCAACHLNFAGGTMVSHGFLAKPQDNECLHCHNSNFVGADYYGRYDHDFHWDYRTPYGKDGSDAPRPYGVNTHQLSTDIHQQAGLQCIDCHPGSSLMNPEPSAITCTNCHEYDGQQPSPLNIRLQDGLPMLTTAKTILPIPQLQHPAHETYKNKAGCTVCHGVWSFSDQGTHLFRQDAEEYDDWEAISIQGSYEVEHEIYANINGEGYPYPFMADKLTGQGYYGLWHKGYELRRWEFPIVCKDSEGVLQICRPLLDLSLTWVNDEGDVLFDNARPNKGPAKGLLPYTPHTIGKAGPFYKERLKTNTELLDYPLNLDKTVHKSEVK